MTLPDEHNNYKTRYEPMNFELEKGKPSASNLWIRMTCTEGKNRQIRNVLKRLGLTVTRLIRISFGDYQLQTIPPGMALEVPVKDVAKQMHKGRLFQEKKRQQQQRHSNHKRNDTGKARDSKHNNNNPQEAPPIQWVRHYR